MSAPPADLPADWPHRDASAEVASAPHRWHVQSFGAGPDVWMLHGAGASAHSFRALGPRIAQAGWRVSVPDLPGHGFTRMGQPRRSGLRPMAEDLARLMATLDRPPVALIGHSAGGALALELVRLLGPGPRAVVTLNAALGHFRGVAGWLFPMLARLLALSPLVPPVFARSTGQAQVARLLAGTGSEVDAEGGSDLGRNHPVGLGLTRGRDLGPEGAETAFHVEERSVDLAKQGDREDDVGQLRR